MLCFVFVHHTAPLLPVYSARRKRTDRLKNAHDQGHRRRNSTLRTDITTGGTVTQNVYLRDCPQVDSLAGFWQSESFGS